MNRRSFIKRLAAVAAGAVVVPTMLEKLPPKIPYTHYDAYTWTQTRGLYVPGRPNKAPLPYLNEVSRSPKHELGSIACVGDGRVYKYMKNCTTEQLIAGAIC